MKIFGQKIQEKKTKHSWITSDRKLLDNLTIKFCAKKQVNWITLNGPYLPCKHNNLVLRYLRLKVLCIYEQKECVYKQIYVMYWKDIYSCGS